MLCALQHAKLNKNKLSDYIVFVKKIVYTLKKKNFRKNMDSFF